MKALIFDSSTLISFSMNSLLGSLKKLKKEFNGKFIITNEVKYEVIDRPINVKRFELEALRVKQLLNEKILEMPESLGVSKEEVSEETNKMMDAANSMFYSHRKNIQLIQSGEASCLALSRILSKKKIPNLIAVDERTTRMLGEKPENLKKLLERKLHEKISLKKRNFDFFKGFKFIRSAEIVYVLWKRNLLEIKDRAKLLDALLYAVKFKGCAISEDEIKDIKKIQ